MHLDLKNINFLCQYITLATSFNLTYSDKVLWLDDFTEIRNKSKVKKATYIQGLNGWQQKKTLIFIVFSRCYTLALNKTYYFLVLYLINETMIKIHVFAIIIIIPFIIWGLIWGMDYLYIFQLTRPARTTQHRIAKHQSQVEYMYFQNVSRLDKKYPWMQ